MKRTVNVTDPVHTNYSKEKETGFPLLGFPGPNNCQNTLHVVKQILLHFCQ